MGEWFSEHLGWMYWTRPSAIVFTVLFSAIAAMAVWDRLSPGYSRKGLLPFTTTRGDRFFIGVMAIVGIHLLWLGVVGATLLWGAVALAALCFCVTLRWG